MQPSALHDHSKETLSDVIPIILLKNYAEALTSGDAVVAPVVVGSPGACGWVAESVAGLASGVVETGS